MKTKVSTLFAAYVVLTAIINEKRALPQKGKFRVARLYDQLTPEFKNIDKERDDLVKKFGEEILEAPKDGQTEPVPTGRWHVPATSPKFQDFAKAWDEFAATEIDITAEKIPLADLGDDGSIESGEFLSLLEFVKA